MRNKNIIFRVSEEEFFTIQKHAKSSGFDSVSDYIRNVSINGYFLKIDTSQLNQIRNEINAIGRNINQIAKVANTEKNIDIEIIKLLDSYILKIDNLYQEIYSKLLFIRGKHGN